MGAVQSIETGVQAGLQVLINNGLRIVDVFVSFVGPGTISYVTGIALKHAGDLYRLLLTIPVLRFALLASQWGLTRYYLLFVIESYWGEASFTTRRSHVVHAIRSRIIGHELGFTLSSFMAS